MLIRSLFMFTYLYRSYCRWYASSGVKIGARTAAPFSDYKSRNIVFVWQCCFFLFSSIHCGCLRCCLSLSAINFRANSSFFFRLPFHFAPLIQSELNTIQGVSLKCIHISTIRHSLPQILCMITAVNLASSHLFSLWSVRCIAIFSTLLHPTNGNSKEKRIHSKQTQTQIWIWPCNRNGKIEEKNQQTNEMSMLLVHLHLCQIRFNFFLYLFWLLVGCVCVRVLKYIFMRAMNWFPNTFTGINFHRNQPHFTFRFCYFAPFVFVDRTRDFVIRMLFNRLPFYSSTRALKVCFRYASSCIIDPIENRSFVPYFRISFLRFLSLKSNARVYICIWYRYFSVSICVFVLVVFSIRFVFNMLSYPFCHKYGIFALFDFGSLLLLAASPYPVPSLCVFVCLPASLLHWLLVSDAYSMPTRMGMACGQKW